MIRRRLCRLRLKCSWKPVYGDVEGILITKGRRCVYCNRVQILQQSQVWLPRTRNSWWVTVRQRGAPPKAQMKEVQ